MKKTKFAVFTDLHYDHIPDGLERMKGFLDRIKDKDVDFIINLGDFCKPTDRNIELVKLLENTGIPCYHTLGNHDSDEHPKEQVLEFLNMTNSHYSFKQGDVKFIALDTCYIEEKSGFIPFDMRNYAVTEGTYPVLPPNQLEWLESELEDESTVYIIMSHHSMENEFKKRGIQNKEQVHRILTKASNDENRKILCINGHDHANSFKKIDNITYLGINGMSYIWLGALCNQRPYEDELYLKYPLLRDIILYEEGLHAVITINHDNSISIEGMEGDYKTISPEDLGIDNIWNGRELSPSVETIDII